MKFFKKIALNGEERKKMMNARSSLFILLNLLKNEKS